MLIAGHSSRARPALTKGDLEAAEAALGQARALIESAPDPEWRSRFDRLQLELELAQGRLRDAVLRADELHRQRADQGGLTGDAAPLAAARTLIVKADARSLDRALALLTRVLDSAEAEGRMGVTIEALALLALARRRRGDTTSALTATEHALRLAEPEGFVRTFADLGLPMARLLQEAHSRQVMTEYIERLLAAYAPSPPGDRRGTALPDALTPREREVLELVAAGLTNGEIGRRLLVSPETVKKHVGSICGELGVGNRTAAVARARELHLLE